jgi:hypothetical protein
MAVITVDADKLGGLPLGAAVAPVSRPDWANQSGAVVPRVDQSVYWKSDHWWWESTTDNRDYFASPAQVILQSISREVQGQVATTTSRGAGAGAEWVAVVSVTGIAVGKTVAVELDNSIMHVTSIVGFQGAPDPAIQLAAVLPSAIAAAGNRVRCSNTTRLTAAAAINATVIAVRNTATLAPGDLVRVELDSGAVSIRTVSSVSGLNITLSSGIGGPAAAGKWVGKGSYDVSPDLIMARRVSGGYAGDLLGNIAWTGPSSGATDAADTNYAQIYAQIQDGSAPSGRLKFDTVQAGSLGPRLILGAGLFSPTVTGGDKGAESINVKALYINGQAVVATGGGRVLLEVLVLLGLAAALAGFWLR